MTPVPAVAILEGANQPRSEIMRAALFHAIPSDRARDWRHFRQEAAVFVMPLKNVDTLSENVWLIRLPDIQLSMHELAKIARKNAILYRTLEFEHEGQWLLSQ